MILQLLNNAPYYQEKFPTSETYIFTLTSFPAQDLMHKWCQQLFIQTEFYI